MGRLDLPDKPRDEDKTEQRRWTRRLHWRGGRRFWDRKKVEQPFHWSSML